MAIDRTFFAQSDLPLAKEDTVVDQVLDHGVKVQRKILAGTRVPPDLIDAYAEATGDSQAAAAGTDEATNYNSMNVEDLQAEADRRGLTVEGTGKDGNVLKSDLVAALEASD